ncbi:AAA family ATPase [Donghicola sp. C2-DW-16]|uniref:AAA family ATPase n=1 Tax=Donghicola mangrovi TaxID=2729614 RepID=A0ABX2PHW6_9RHOB|nr:AAA family ATPase [Donghicola mangrovi]NVO28174.1 AAA family ATPase [Donghicola mangrovi]
MVALDYIPQISSYRLSPVHLRFQNTWTKMKTTKQFLLNVDLSTFDLDATDKPRTRSPRFKKNLRSTAHLKREEKDRLRDIESGCDLVGFDNQHQIDVLMAEMFEQMPWMQSALKFLSTSMQQNHMKNSYMGFSPILLVGPPGTGKSHLARMIAQKVKVPFLVNDVSNGGEAFGLTGLRRGWSSAQPGSLLDTMIQTKVMNPIVVVDEIDKATARRGDDNQQTSVIFALLALLERVSACEWDCPFYKLPFDMSHVNWILTANSLKGLPEPLLTRCKIIEIEALAVSDLLIAAQIMGAPRGLQPDDIASLERVLKCYPPDSPRLNLRTVAYLLDGLEHTLSRPLLH